MNLRMDTLFVPVLLTVLTLFVLTLNSTLDLKSSRESLIAQHAAQDGTLAEAQKLRSQLESIAGDTATLADQGNQNAIKLRDYLQQQGIKISPPQQSSATAPSSNGLGTVTAP
jgi:hypothetical protein